MDTLRITYPKSRAVIASGAGLALVLLGLEIALFRATEFFPNSPLFGYLIVFAGLPFLLVGGIHLLRKTVILEASPRGVLLANTRHWLRLLGGVQQRYFTWAEIADVREGKIEIFERDANKSTMAAVEFLFESIPKGFAPEKHFTLHTSPLGIAPEVVVDKIDHLRTAPPAS